MLGHKELEIRLPSGFLAATSFEGKDISETLKEKMCQNHINGINMYITAYKSTNKHIVIKSYLLFVEIDNKVNSSILKNNQYNLKKSK
jgi:hypothetical protein